MANAYNILLVEPSDEQAARLKEAIERISGFRIVSRVPDGLAAVAYIRGQGQAADREQFPLPEIVLLDSSTPQLEHIDFIQWAQRRIVRPVLATFATRDNADSRKLADELQADLYEPNIWDTHVLSRFVHFAANISYVRKRERT